MIIIIIIMSCGKVSSASSIVSCVRFVLNVLQFRIVYTGIGNRQIVFFVDEQNDDGDDGVRVVCSVLSPYFLIHLNLLLIMYVAPSFSIVEIYPEIE